MAKRYKKEGCMKEKKKSEFITIKCKNKKYRVNIKKIIYILRQLESNEKLKIFNLKDLFLLLKKYKLYNDIFFMNIENL